MNKIQEIIKNIEFELNLYKNNELITKELNNLKDMIEKMKDITLNDVIKVNIDYYDVILSDKITGVTAKQKRTYNFMLNFLVSNK